MANYTVIKVYLTSGNVVKVNNVKSYEVSLEEFLTIHTSYGGEHIFLLTDIEGISFMTADDAARQEY